LTRTKGVDANYNLSLREIALSCGHMKVWRKVLDENLEYALIVEDDSWPLHDYEYLVKTHKELFKDIDYDVIQLHHPHQSYNCSDSSAKWTKHPTLNIEKANPCGFGTIGYIVSQRGAKRLMYETKIQPSDWIVKSISRQHDSTYNTVEDFFEHEKVHPSTIRYCDNSKIFGVGSQKTGTSTLCKMLNILGYETAHWGKHHNVFENPNGIDWNDPLFRNIDAFADIPIPKYYKELDRRFPNSKFILTIRNEDEWIESNEAHQKWLTNNWSKPLLPSEQFYYGIDKFDKTIFLDKYKKTNEDILNHFKNRPNDLLVFDMSNGFDWKPICDFLNKDIPNKKIPHKMKRKS